MCLVCQTNKGDDGVAKWAQDILAQWAKEMTPEDSSTSATVDTNYQGSQLAGLSDWQGSAAPEAGTVTAAADGLLSSTAKVVTACVVGVIALALARKARL